MFDEFIPMPVMTLEQIKLYAERIGYNGSLEPTKEVLDELIWHHQLSVPFETIDCHDLKIGVDIHPEAVFDKLVRRHRGGHCLETNGCFFRLLISLGFDARPCLCKVLLGTDEFTHPIDHRTALVNLDGHTYYCDVGVGGPMPPAGLDIGTQEWQNLRADCYAVRPSDEFGWYYICRKTPYGNHDAGNSR